VDWRRPGRVLSRQLSNESQVGTVDDLLSSHRKRTGLRQPRRTDTSNEGTIAAGWARGSGSHVQQDWQPSCQQAPDQPIPIREAAADFPWRPAFRGAPLDVGTGGGVCEASGPGDDVQCAVQLPVPVAVESMPVRGDGSPKPVQRRRGLRRPLPNGPGRGASTRGEDGRRGHRAHPVDVQDSRAMSSTCSARARWLSSSSAPRATAEARRRASAVRRRRQHRRPVWPASPGPS
jgi:hypothetical protein